MIEFAHRGYNDLDRSIAMKPAKYSIALTLAWIVIAGVFIRVWGLWDYWLSPDEATYMYAAGAPELAVMYERLLGEAHPPTLYPLLRLLLELSREVFLLKALFSLLPGAGIIILVYFLGREVTGEAAGLFASFLAAFGFGPVILSQVIRPYSMAALFVIGALLFCLRSWNGKSRDTAFYVVLMLFAVCLHYSFALVLAAVSGAWLVRLSLEKRGRGEVSRFIVLHLPLLGAAVLFYCFHISRLSSLLDHVVGGYLGPCMHDGPAGLLQGAYSLLHYFFYRGGSPVLALLCLLGVYALLRSRRYLLLGIILLLLISMVLSLLKLYPFCGARQCFYFFPFLALLASGGLQLVISGCWRLYCRLSSGSTEALEARRQMFANIGLAALSVCVVPLLFHYAGFDFLREYGYARNNEFPVKRAVYRGALDHIIENASPEDIIIVPRQTADQLDFSAGSRGMVALSGSFAKVRYKGLDFFFSHDYWLFKEKGQIARVLLSAADYKPVQKGSSIWIFNIGYGSKWLMESLNELLSGPKVPVEIFSGEYTQVLSMPPGPALKAARECM